MTVTPITHPYRHNRFPNRKDIVKAIKGCLEVITNCDSMPGVSTNYRIPKDTIGYVLANNNNNYLVLWPTLLEPDFFSSDEIRNRCNRPVISSHNKNDLNITGNRG